MRKSEFQAIARAIKDSRDALLAQVPVPGTDYIPGLTQVECDEQNAARFGRINRAFDSMARDIAKVLARQNAKFSKTRFLEECGITTRAL